MIITCVLALKKLSKIGKIASYHLEIQILQNSHLDPLSPVHFAHIPKTLAKSHY